MINIQKLRTIDPKIITIGSYPPITQSMLDFDYLSEKTHPSVVAILATGRKYERYFFGRREILIPVFATLEQIPEAIKNSVNLFLNVSSGRRTLQSTRDVLYAFPKLLGGSLFAEDVPEQHAVELYHNARKLDKFIVGPASVGVLIPSVLKLGAIGGTQYQQLIDGRLFEKGSVAVFSASGGMVNEIMNQVTNYNHQISFAIHFGGDRFPIFPPINAFLAAEEDLHTKTIVYYGELGGQDEYEIANLLKEGRITKEILVYIAGAISEIFDEPPQFGHAKAMAKNQEETAQTKRKVLKDAGAQVAESFGEFVEMIKVIKTNSSSVILASEKRTRPESETQQRSWTSQDDKSYTTKAMDLENRKHALIATSISKDTDGDVSILGEDLTNFAKNHSFAYIVASMFLGKQITSKELEEFVDFVLKLLVDHGPYVSGAVNTIITSRAGRDLVSGVSAGLLTIGPRFGGAINQAASNWLKGVSENISPYDFVEDFASQKTYISGIGHKKYRVDLPDSRVQELLKFADKLEHKKFSNYAREVEKITSVKKGNLILNVDGTIAAILLDILSEKEGYSDKQLEELTQTEFFNALFVLSRSVGFISHFLDQKRLDEGLFRLAEEHVADASR